MAFHWPLTSKVALVRSHYIVHPQILNPPLYWYRLLQRSTIVPKASLNCYYNNFQVPLRILASAWLIRLAWHWFGVPLWMTLTMGTSSATMWTAVPVQTAPSLSALPFFPVLQDARCCKTSARLCLTTAACLCGQTVGVARSLALKGSHWRKVWIMGSFLRVLAKIGASLVPPPPTRKFY